jgi:Uma2 family endonuclease
LVVAPAPPAGDITYEQFLEWCDEDTHAEWVDGRVLPMSPASDRHQALILFLGSVLGLFVERLGSGVVRTMGLQMRLAATRSGREPDVLFVSQAHLARLQPNRLEGPADLVIEVVSPDSVERDWLHKRREYEAGGVREYWIVDPLQQRSAFLLLGADGAYQEVAPDAQGIYHSTVLAGLWLRVDWLWQSPLPPVLDVLRELGVVPR